MAAFIVPRIDALNRLTQEQMRDESLNSLRGILSSAQRDSVDQARRIGDAKLVFSVYDRALRDASARDEAIQDLYATPIAVVAQGGSMIARKEGILRQVRSVLFLSVLAIAYCFVQLALAPQWASPPSSATIVVTVGVLVGISCLLSYALLLMRTLRET